MAGTQKTLPVTSMAGSAELEAVAQVANVVADLETLRAAMEAIVTKLNADAGVSATDFAAPAAAALVASSIKRASGATITNP